MDRQLELRKIVQVGYRFDSPEGHKPVLNHLGLPTSKLSGQKYWATVVFWLPAPKPHKPGPGAGLVPNVYPHEREALRAGVLVEHVQEFEFPEEPSAAELRRRLLPVWEALAMNELGSQFHGVPLDSTTPMSLQLSPVFQEPHVES